MKAFRKRKMKPGERDVLLKSFPALVTLMSDPSFKGEVLGHKFKIDCQVFSRMAFDFAQEVAEGVADD